MKFETDLSTILHAVQLVSRIVAPRPPIPSLSGIQLVPFEGGLRLRAMDQVSVVQCTVSIPVHAAAGETCVLPARDLLELLRRVPEGVLVFAIDPERSADIVLGSNKYKIGCLDAADFPDYPRLTPSFSLRLDSEALRSLIRKVAFASASEEGQVAFTGINFCVEQSGEGLATWRLEAAATDGARAAMAWVSCESLGDPPASHREVLLHSRTVTELGRMLALALDRPSAESPARVRVEIDFDEGRIGFRWPGVEVLATPLKAPFPSIKNVIPANYKTAALVEADRLRRACDIATVFSKTSNAAYLRFLPGKLIVESAFPEAGYSLEELPATLTGEPSEAAFNGRLLVQGLDAMDSEWVWFKLSGGEGPAVIAPAAGLPTVGGEGGLQDSGDPLTRTATQALPEEGNVYVVLPLRVR